MDPVEDLNESNFASLTQYLMANTKDKEVRRRVAGLTAATLFA